jgi:alkanesulfonate monooxygenase SsuD/methylene tetrahydromethanopterin reductase-like flavin-dependent oxidoreductase (luciferase family)
MAATFEDISGGRLILGVGCGWNEPEFTAFDFPFDHRVGRFEEALEVLVPARREGRASVSGRWHAADAEILPGLPAPGRTANASVDRRAAGADAPAGGRHADAWNTAWLGPATQLPPRLEGMQAALAEAGRDAASLEITVGINVVLPEFATTTHPPLEVTPSAITGSPTELAAQLRAYADLAVGHVQVALEPTTPPAIRHLGEALRC